MASKSEMLLNELVAACVAFGREREPNWQTRIETARCALKAYIEGLEPRWIPVSERLPEFGAPILFYDSILERINKGTCTAMNSDNTNLHWLTDDDLFYFGNRSEYITHWMPLPTPPEVRE